MIYRSGAAGCERDGVVRPKALAVRKAAGLLRRSLEATRPADRVPQKPLFTTGGASAARTNLPESPTAAGSSIRGKLVPASFSLSLQELNYCLKLHF